MSVTVYVLCKVKMGCIQPVVEAFRQLEVASSISVTTGEIDVIVRLEVPDLEVLYEVTVDRISKIEGLENMSTVVVEKEF